MPVFVALLLVVNTRPVSSLTVVNRATMRSLIQVFLWSWAFILGKCPNGVARSQGACMFSFVRNCQTFSQNLIMFFTPITRVCEFELLHPWPAFGVCCQSLILAILVGVLVVWHCGLNLHFPDDQWYWTFCLCLLASPISSFVTW